MIINSKSKIVVAITQRVDNVEGRNEFRDALDQRLILWLIESGFLPVTIPNVLYNEGSNQPVLDNWLKVLQPQGLVLSGGNDIGEFPLRDMLERYLLSWAESNKFPVLGICRGMQMMSVWAGARLIKVEGHVRTQHPLIIDDTKEEWPLLVNSYHNLQVASCPEQFEVVAQTKDESIEAIRHVTLPWEGWMWHPEREQCFNSIDIIRVKRLFCGKQ